MKAAKVAKLFQLRFLKGLEDGLGKITEEHIRRSCPTLPVPPNARVVGTLPKKFREFLALTLLLEDRKRAAAEICAAEAVQSRTPRYDILRVWTDMADTADNLFWTSLREEIPPPEELAYEEGISTAIGPNFEVYYCVATAEEGPQPALGYTQKEQPSPRVLH